MTRKESASESMQPASLNTAWGIELSSDNLARSNQHDAVALVYANNVDQVTDLLGDCANG